MSNRTLYGALLGGVVLSMSAHAKVVVVDQNGQYPTIQAGVNAAAPGDQVLVRPGIYTEEVIVPISVLIRGSGAGNTIVLPATSRPGSGTGGQIDKTAWLFKVRADDVHLEFMTLDGDNPSLASAVDARGGVVTDYLSGRYTGLVARGLEVKNFSYRGLYANGGGLHSFIGCRISGIKDQPLDSAGIMFYDAQGEATYNEVTDCSVGVGFGEGMSGGLAFRNTVSACDLGLWCYGNADTVRFDENQISACDEGVQCVATNALASVTQNAVNGCFFGLMFFGLGTGYYVADGNTMTGTRVANSAGMFVSTDVGHFGVGDCHLSASRNTFQDYDLGIVLNESPTANAAKMDVRLSGDAAHYNQFADNLSFNLYLQHCNDDVDAEGNSWGVISPAVIEQSIWHQNDDPLLGLVDYSNTVNFSAVVDDDGPADFRTINPAVQALQPGGTIEVKPGIYVEDVVIDRSLVVVGSGTGGDPSRDTILMAASDRPDACVVTVTGSDVVLDKVHIDGTVPTSGRALLGIHAIMQDRLSILHCAVRTATFGIATSSCTNASILANEVWDFGNDAGAGGAIVLTGSTGQVGALGPGNYIHNGKGVGVAFNLGSSGLAEGNRVDYAPLGYLVYGSDGGITTLHQNQVTNSGLGFEAIANQRAVDYFRNTILTCDAGFAVYGQGPGVHTFVDNHIDTNSRGSSGLYAATFSPLGEGDCHLTMRGSTFTESQYGILFEESPASHGYHVSADLSALGDPSWITGDFQQEIQLENCDDNLPAEGNYFGTSDPVAVENKIHHKVDDPALGLVDYQKFISSSPELRVRGILQLGYRITLALKGAAGSTYVFFASPGTSDIPTPYGPWLLDPIDFTVLRAGTIGGRGMYNFSANVPFAFVGGSNLYFQGFVGNGPDGTLSNLQVLTAP